MVFRLLLPIKDYAEGYKGEHTMYVDDLDQLDALTDDQLWEVAADAHIAAELRHEALQRWLYPEDNDPDIDQDELGGGRMPELIERATLLDPDEVEEDDIEEFDRSGPYFDGEGRLIVEYNGAQYLIDSMEDEGTYGMIQEEGDLEDL